MATSQVRTASGWQEMSAVQLYDGSSWRNVQEVFLYFDFAWAKVFPGPLPATQIIGSVSNPVIYADQVTILGAQVSDANGDPVGESRSISWSRISGSGFLDLIDNQTNNAGFGEARYNPTSSTSGTVTYRIDSPGLTSGTSSVTVLLYNGQWDIQFARNDYGLDASISAPEYNISATVTSPGSIMIQNNSQVVASVPPVNNVRPSGSQTATTVECTQGSWTLRPTITLTINGSAPYYQSKSSSYTNTPTGTSTFSYQWQYFDGTWINWGNPLSSGTKIKGSLYDSTIKGKQLRCRVTATRAGVISGSATCPEFVGT